MSVLSGGQCTCVHGMCRSRDPHAPPVICAPVTHTVTSGVSALSPPGVTSGVSVLSPPGAGDILSVKLV